MRRIHYPILLRNVEEAKGQFVMAFGRDVDYHDQTSEATYLDRCTGKLLWIYEIDDDAYMMAGLSAEENRVPSIKSIQTELGFGPVLYGGYVDSYWAMGQIKGHTAVVDAVV